MSVNQYAIIVAGGTGSRIKNTLPKQFIEVNGKPIIAYTISKFFEYNSDISICIAVHADYVNHLDTILKAYFPGKKIQYTVGGETRFHSVKNALNLIKDLNAVVGIHDAARPMVSIDTIQRCYETALQKGNATPAIAVNESLRVVSNGTNKAVDRSDFRIIQTPQCFEIQLLKKAFEQEYNTSFTDDASVVEKCGQAIHLVEGNVENIKITYPADLIIAQHNLK